MSRRLLAVRFTGLKEFQRDLQRGDKEAVTILSQEFARYGNRVERVAKQLSPRDEGDLEASITTTRPKRMGAGMQMELGSNKAYALRRHEEPPRKGTHDKYGPNGRHRPGYYVDGRGGITRSKRGVKGYQPGRKYIENAVRATETDIKTMEARALGRMIDRRRGGR